MPVMADQTQVKTTDLREPQSQNTQYRWWDHVVVKEVNAPEENNEANKRLANSIWYSAEQIFRTTRPMRLMHYYFNMMYHDVNHGQHMHSPQLTDLNYDVEGFHTEGASGCTLNVVQSAIDTAAAMISKNKPKPLVLTSGAKDNSLKITAENATKYLQGVYDMNDVYDKAQEAFTEACIVGTGAMRVRIDKEDKQIKIDWIFSQEILVDWLDGRDKTPCQMHYKHYYNRDELLEQYPDSQKQIMADTGATTSNTTYQSIADVVSVVESWHLPTGKMKNGLHCIAIRGHVLLCEEYDKDYFPFVFFRWYPHTPGFWGRGIAAEVGNLYLQVNKQLDTIDEALNLMQNAAWMIEKSSGVAEEELSSNEIGKQVYYNTTMPQFQVPQAVISADTYAHTWQLVNQVYQIAGVSQQNATGQKEDNGVTSAVGQQEVQDIATGRFEVVAQRYEKFLTTELASIVMDLSADLFKDYPNLSVQFKEKRGLSNINFKDANLKANPFTIDCFPISSLPYSPAARMDRVMGWIANGWITREEGMALLDYPDLQDTISLQTSTTTFVANCMSAFKQGEDYIEPLQELDLNLAFNLSSSEVVRATNEKVPTDDIAKIRQFKEDCLKKMQTAKQIAALLNPPPPPPPITAQPGPASMPPAGMPGGMQPPIPQ